MYHVTDPTCRFSSPRFRIIMQPQTVQSCCLNRDLELCYTVLPPYFIKGRKAQSRLACGKGGRVLILTPQPATTCIVPRSPSFFRSFCFFIGLASPEHPVNIFCNACQQHRLLSNRSPARVWLHFTSHQSSRSSAPSSQSR